MIQTCINLFKNKEIRNKIYFTLAMMFIVLFGGAIPAPRVNSEIFGAVVANNSLLNMMNILGGGSLEKLSIFALGVGPYITASIVIQLLSMDVIPALTEMSKSGQTGRIKLDKITRYLAVVLAMVQSSTMMWSFDVVGFSGISGIIVNGSLSVYLYIALVMTAGTMFLMWIGDQISTKGIGNGMSMIIFTGIVSNIPFQFIQAYKTLVGTSSSTSMFNGMLTFAAYIMMYVLIIVLVIFMQLAVRKIPIQYTSSSVQKSKQDMNFLPLKINSASVVPVIFASSIMTAPITIASFFQPNDFTKFMENTLSLQKPIGLCIYAVLIVLFTFFYTNLQVDPQKIADDLGKNGTYIPGIRPGVETKEYVSKVLNRITVLGSGFLLFIALLPYLLTMFTSLPNSTGVFGTGIIIVVGVAMETMTQLKGQLTQKQYRGFIHK